MRIPTRWQVISLAELQATTLWTTLGSRAVIVAGGGVLPPPVATAAGIDPIPADPVGIGSVAVEEARVNCRKPEASVRRSAMPGSPAGNRSMTTNVRSKAGTALAVSFRSNAALPSPYRLRAICGSTRRRTSLKAMRMRGAASSSPGS